MSADSVTSRLRESRSRSPPSRAEGRRFRTCSQTEALQTIQAMLGVPGPLDAFIQEAIDDDGVRRQRTALLRAQAQPFSYSDFAPTAP